MAPENARVRPGELSEPSVVLQMAPYVPQFPPIRLPRRAVRGEFLRSPGTQALLNRVPRETEEVEL